MLRILCISLSCNFPCGEAVSHVHLRNSNYTPKEDHYYLCFIGHLKDTKRVIKVATLMTKKTWSPIAFFFKEKLNYLSLINRNLPT